jgi:hypothetical protein
MKKVSRSRILRFGLPTGVVAIQSAWDGPTGKDYHLHRSAFIGAVTAALK